MRRTPSLNELFGFPVTETKLGPRFEELVDRFSVLALRAVKSNPDAPGTGQKKVMEELKELFRGFAIEVERAEGEDPSEIEA